MTVKELLDHLWGFPEDTEICVFDMTTNIRHSIESTDWVFKNIENKTDGLIVDLHINEE
jgi:hypothetical protein